MPTPYVYGQTPLEKAAIAQRLFLIQQSKVGTGKVYVGPYKNPVITGNLGDKYSVTHPNALSNAGNNALPYTPSYGKGTNQQINVTNTQLGVVARLNYDGGSKEDRDGVLGISDSGRNAQLQLNTTTFGYGPGPTPGPSIGFQYAKPSLTAFNTGKIIY
jgi:hypothetical protein